MSQPTENVTVGNSLDLTALFAVALLVVGFTFSDDVVEFLCDIADYPAPNVPASVRQAARSDANQRSTGRFINGPGYSCGAARPW